MFVGDAPRLSGSCHWGQPGPVAHWLGGTLPYASGAGTPSAGCSLTGLQGSTRARPPSTRKPSGQQLPREARGSLTVTPSEAHPFIAGVHSQATDQGLAGTDPALACAQSACQASSKPPVAFSELQAMVRQRQCPEQEAAGGGPTELPFPGAFGSLDTKPWIRIRMGLFWSEAHR